MTPGVPPAAEAQDQALLPHETVSDCLFEHPVSMAAATHAMQRQISAVLRFVILVIAEVVACIFDPFVVGLFKAPLSS